MKLEPGDASVKEMKNESPVKSDDAKILDAIVIGAGFAGMHMLLRLRRLGLRVLALERGGGVGGTWYWNRYPGCRCDVESVLYSYGFSKDLDLEWTWSERYASQDEILRYADHVADRFDLRRDIAFHENVRAAIFDEEASVWRIETDNSRYSARFLITAAGCLSAGMVPDFKGLSDFKGQWYHTGNWPHSPVDLRGKTVGLIGTGSTGIQFATRVAKEAGHLFVFQRTPNFSVPAANAPLDDAAKNAYKARYDDIRAECRAHPLGIMRVGKTMSALDESEDRRREHYEQQWNGTGFGTVLAYSDLLTNLEANHTIAEFAREKIRAIVKDPQVAEKLCPTTYPFGTKRLCLDSGYYQIFNQDNVTLVDLREDPIDTIHSTGLQTQSRQYDLDVLVFATGYDAISGPLNRIDIRGRAGRSLREHWRNGPRTYLGLMSDGFPNLFTVTGPGSPSVLVNMMISIEQHVDWIARCIENLRRENLDVIEPATEAVDEWTLKIDAIAQATLFPMADSWYMGANVNGKPRRFVAYAGGMDTYRAICDEVVDNGYAGFDRA